jgi:hypothetical protein
MHSTPSSTIMRRNRGGSAQPGKRESESIAYLAIVCRGCFGALKDPSEGAKTWSSTVDHLTTDSRLTMKGQKLGVEGYLLTVDRFTSNDGRG